jgi:Tfp pilus assembly protein PilO
MENLDFGTIITVIISGLTIFAGGFWLKAKGKLSKVINLGRQALDVAATLEKALEDNKVDKAEIKALKKELSEVKGAWKALTKKE